jgi:polyphosphate kinase 2 (PPK2 family)
MRPIAEHLPKMCEFDVDKIIVPPGASISLKKDYDPDYTGRFSDKAAAKEDLARNIAELTELQERLYANDTYAFLLVFQAMDAAGKDGTIKHVMSGINPQGCQSRGNGGGGRSDTHARRHGISAGGPHISNAFLYDISNKPYCYDS